MMRPAGEQVMLLIYSSSAAESESSSPHQLLRALRTHLNNALDVRLQSSQTIADQFSKVRKASDERESVQKETKNRKRNKKKPFLETPQ